MYRGVKAFLILTVVSSFCSSRMRAEAPPESATTLTAENQAQTERELKQALVESAGQKPAVPGNSLNWLKRNLGLSVYVQAANLYNAVSSRNDLRIFDHRANAATFDIGEVVLNRDAPLGGLGGRFKLIAGETARFIHETGLGIDSGDNPQNTMPVDLTEFYAEYNAPIGTGLHITFGKWATVHGAEVIEAIDNPNYSRSFLFNYAEPFTHTGLRLSTTIAGMLTLGFQAVEGWDVFQDNNESMTFGYTVSYAPCEKFTFTANFMHGPEQNDDNSSQRYFLSMVSTVKPIKDVTFLLCLDRGWEESVPAIGGHAAWHGFSGIVKYEPVPWLGFALRGEVFDDTDGSRTGMKQELKEVTLSADFKWRGFVLRPEYRHDWSDQHAFDGGSRHAQHIFGFALMYRW